jgi:hypothetical protein
MEKEKCKLCGMEFYEGHIKNGFCRSCWDDLEGDDEEDY